MNDFYEARNSIYCYPGSSVLVNKFNIKNYNKLMEIETDIVVYKSFELRQEGITGNFDIQHLVGIHKYLFCELYPFAGLFRTENIAKDNFRFAEWEFIEDELRKLLEQLKNEKYLERTRKKQPSTKVSILFSRTKCFTSF